ncbi:MAG: dockerin type I repeat-containing protein [Eubacteriales bacterium]|nr:dockerin type I repeat-containing protein [Eubacteriales bacterium]
MKKSFSKVLAVALSMVLMLSLCTMAGVQAVTIDYDAIIKDGEVYDAMYDYLKQYHPKFESGPIYAIFMVYENYSDKEASPDWAVVEVYSSATDTRCYHEINGYYIYCLHPSLGEKILPYYVVDMETKEVTALADAINASPDEYMPFFTDSGYDRITRIGDLNGDKNLDIKDATLIQKCLARLDTFDSYDDMLCGFPNKDHGKWSHYISDFNRDCKRNIKDATAIQQYIAGM